MNKYVLVPDEDNELKARFYLGNVLLIKNQGSEHKHYLEDNGGGSFTLYNTNPNESYTNHIVRCPCCTSKLVRTAVNRYQCFYVKEDNTIF
jgi:hypothetical protein